MTHELRTIRDKGHFFEAPRWRAGEWWVSDLYSERVLAISEDGTEIRSIPVPGHPSGLGWMADGSLLIVSMQTQRVMRWDPAAPDAELRVHADLGAVAEGPLNDMIVDQRGLAYVGCFGSDLSAGEEMAPAPLIAVSPDGVASIAAEGLMFPNGSVLTDDGATLIVGETLAGRYTAFDIGDEGNLTGRRVWAQIGTPPPLGPVGTMHAALSFTPDGCAIDAQNRIWVADTVNRRCCRLHEGGKVDAEIAAPAGQTFFACALGGNDRTTLLLCAAPDFDAGRRSAAEEALLLTVDIS